MSKADFISNEWLGILERAARAAGGFAHLEASFLQLRSDVMADFEKLKAEVDETVSGVKTAVAYIGGVKAELQAALDKLASGQTVDYSELVAKLDAAQADINSALAPAEKLPEQVDAAVEAGVAEAVAEIPPAEPTP